MKHRINQTCCTVATCMALVAGFAGMPRAQAPAGASAAAPAQTTPPAAPPHYVSIPLEIVVNRPAAEVWQRVGKYCDIGEWLQIACTITAGKDGEVGVIRSIGNEIMVGKTQYSYSYTQPPRPDRPYNLYHGTLEVRPLTATSCTIYYTLFYDNSMLADDAARDRDTASRTMQFTRAIQNMKTLAEGGTLPPPPARGTRGGAAPGTAAPPAGAGR